jgi:potassium efflux system protein
VPQINAAAAFSRADGLIGEIDELLRERQQQQLLQLDPTPLNPVNWAVALGALRDVVVTMQSQIANRVGDPVRRDALADNARRGSPSWSWSGSCSCSAAGDGPPA